MDQALDYIQTFDLQFLVPRLIDQYDWDPKNAEDEIRKYRNFLTLGLLFPNVPLVPTSGIDAVWHEHILHTKKYTEDCDRIFGKYFHHSPAGDGDKEGLEPLYRETARHYERYFQEPYDQFDITLWFN